MVYQFGEVDSEVLVVFAIYEKNTVYLFKGLKASNQPSLMNVMMELRKCCNHPYLVKGVEERVMADLTSEEQADQLISHKKLIECSGKLVLLDKLLPKLHSQGHKVLIFSQMVRVLNLLEDFLRYKGYSFERLDGSSRSSDRKEAVDRFCKPSMNRFIMLLSTKAGGLGLNLTAADTVIIFDSDWNPQNDLQAQARAHRIGQTRAVMVYRLLTRKTYGKSPLLCLSLQSIISKL
jgi:chromodomain-helicase-DNA-binding protein 7